MLLREDREGDVHTVSAAAGNSTQQLSKLFVDTWPLLQREVRKQLASTWIHCLRPKAVGKQISSPVAHKHIHLTYFQLEISLILQTFFSAAVSVHISMLFFCLRNRSDLEVSIFVAY